jgi:hypothetical protein
VGSPWAEAWSRSRSSPPSRLVPEIRVSGPPRRQQNEACASCSPYEKTACSVCMSAVSINVVGLKTSFTSPLQVSARKCQTAEEQRQVLENTTNVLADDAAMCDYCRCSFNNNDSMRPNICINLSGEGVVPHK